MIAGERFKIWVDETAMSFKDRLRGWMASWLSFGVEVLMDTIAKRASPMLKPTIERIERETEIPPELKPIFNELKEPTAEFGALLANNAGGALVGGAIGKILDFLLRPITLGFSYVPGFVLLDPPQLLALWRRGKITEDELNGRLHQLGLGGDTIPELESLIDTRLDPANWITAFRRKYEDFSKVEDDLKHQGWSEDRIEALKFVTLYYPGPTEVMTWAAREVFEPELREKFQLDKFMPPEFKEWAEKAGITGEVADNYWAAHWALPSISEVTELWRRKIWDKETVDDFCLEALENISLSQRALRDYLVLLVPGYVYKQEKVSFVCTKAQVHKELGSLTPGDSPGFYPLVYVRLGEVALALDSLRLG